MADEYYERYRHRSHQELYQMLRAGSPDQVHDLARKWKSIEDTAAALAANLSADLDRLGLSWTGAGSGEFQRRVRSIVRFALTLRDEAAAMRTGLSAMASALREAQRIAEYPDGVTPAPAFDGVVRGVLDAESAGIVGTAMVQEELNRARERMVQLVSNLAAQYGVVDHGTWPVAVSPPPPELPAGIGTALAGLPPVATAAVDRAGGTALLGAGAEPLRAATVPTGAGTIAAPLAAGLAAGAVRPVAAPLLGSGPSGLTGRPLDVPGSHVLGPTVHGGPGAAAAPGGATGHGTHGAHGAAVGPPPPVLGAAGIPGAGSAGFPAAVPAGGTGSAGRPVEGHADWDLGSDDRLSWQANDSAVWADDEAAPGILG